MAIQESWPTRLMNVNRRRLEELRDLVDNYTYDEPEASAELARFLVIRSAGYVEYIFDTCIETFAESKSHPAIASHVRASLFKGRNVRPSTLLDRTKDLSESWHEQLESFLDEDDAKVKRELDYMVDRRNKIAHGQSEGVGRRKAIDLANIALDTGDKLVRIIQPW